MGYITWMGLNHKSEDCKLLAGCKKLDKEAVDTHCHLIHKSKGAAYCPECYATSRTPEKDSSL